MRPSVTATSSGRRPLSGDSGSMTAVRMNLSRSMFAAVNTAEPTLAMVCEPECDGAGGNLLSPRAKHTRLSGIPRASAATCVIEVYGLAGTCSTALGNGQRRGHRSPRNRGLDCRHGPQGSGATTVLRAHGVLSGILADAVKAKRLAVNPAKGVENLPRKTGERRVYLSADDVYRLANE
jgi:hypothetical protein